MSTEKSVALVFDHPLAALLVKISNVAKDEFNKLPGDFCSSPARGRMVSWKRVWCGVVCIEFYPAEEAGGGQ